MCTVSSIVLLLNIMGHNRVSYFTQLIKHSWNLKTQVWIPLGVLISIALIRNNLSLSVELIFKHILELFLNLFYTPLSGLSWKTDIFRTEELRAGCFSIHQNKIRKNAQNFFRICLLYSKTVYFLQGSLSLFELRQLFFTKWVQLVLKLL